MQRNRDLNGDGNIDGDEIKWYTPALDQYCAFWYGEEALPTYARLFQGSVADVVQNYVDHDNCHHYLTSTSGNKGLFYAIEGSSYNSYPQQYASLTHNTRCIRNLKNATEAPVEATKLIGRYISVNNFVESAYRNSTQNGPYPQHHERDIANKLPHAFKVAKNDITEFNINVTKDLRAPNISSAVSRNGQTTLTFASVESGAVAYYYTTTNTASQDNRIEPVNNQFVIEDFVLVDGDGKTYSAPNIDITATTATVNTINLKFASVEDGATYSYSTSQNGNKTSFTITNNEFTINYNYSYGTYRTTFDVWIWATKDNQSLYTRVRITRGGTSGNRTYTASIHSKQDDVTTETPPTKLYIWAFDQTMLEFSNPTIVTYAGIEVGDDKTITRNAISDYDDMRWAAITQDLCADYTESTDPDGAPKWRVPNQRELTAINHYNTELKIVGTYKHAYFSCTQYSNAINASAPVGSSSNSRRYSYMIENNDKNHTAANYIGGGVVALDTRATSYHIRCVRDLAPGEVMKKDDTTDSEGGDGGGI
jgi:hypothetical protein